MALTPTQASDLSGGIGDVATGVSDIFAGFGDQFKAKGAELEAQSYQEAAALALQNEQFTRESTAIKEAQASRELYMSLGRTQAQVAGAGFSASGSALDILRSSAQQGALTRATIQQQGLITEAGYQEQANAYQNMAAAANEAAKSDTLGEIGSDIAGGLKIAASVAMFAAV